MSLVESLESTDVQSREQNKHDIRVRTQSAWWQILRFPIVDSNILVDTITLEKDREFSIDLPLDNIEEKENYIRRDIYHVLA